MNALGCGDGPSSNDAQNIDQRTEGTMNESVRLHRFEPVAASATADLRARCEYALELMLTHRGNPSLEVDGALGVAPHCVSAHCLRIALIVRADDEAARPALAASAAVTEARRPDRDDPARRHAAAARAWLEGDMALAFERYGAIVIDRPRDVVALALAHEVGPMAYITHSKDCGRCSDRTAPVANGVGAKLARLARRLTDALAAQRQREVDREIARLLARSGGRITDSMEREIMRKILEFH